MNNPKTTYTSPRSDNEGVVLELCLQIEIWFETNDVNIQEQHKFITHTIDQNYLATISK